jgi:hypothetical protein
MLREGHCSCMTRMVAPWPMDEHLFGAFSASQETYVKAKQM